MGLESELLIVPNFYARGDLDARQRIFNHVAGQILKSQKWLRRKMRTQYYFLENGGAFNYEAPMISYFDGLIETSTPECSNPKELALWSAAMDRIVMEAAKDVDGAEGAAIFKTGTDSAGNTFGSHENYEIQGMPRGWRRNLFSFFWYALVGTYVPIYFALTVLSAVWAIAIIIIAISLFGLLIPALIIGVPVLAVYGALTKQHELPSAFVTDNYNSVARMGRGLVSGKGMYPLLWMFQIVHAPGTALAQILLDIFLMKKLNRYLSVFLATRIIFTGSGGLATRYKYILSPRAMKIMTTVRMWLDDPFRPMVSTHPVVKELDMPLRNSFRLHLICGDPTMIPFATYLRFGTTALVIKAIQAGADFEEMRLNNPVRTMHEISWNTALSVPVKLKNKKKMTPIEIQRKILEICEPFAEIDWEKEVIADWRYVLDCLETDPGMLYKELDWVAKRDVVLAASDSGDWYEMKRADLWFQALDEENGIYFELARDEHTAELFAQEEIQMAMCNPPLDTPARLRGELIKTHGGSMGAGWCTWTRLYVQSLRHKFNLSS